MKLVSTVVVASALMSVGLIGANAGQANDQSTNAQPSPSATAKKPSPTTGQMAQSDPSSGGGSDRYSAPDKNQSYSNSAPDKSQHPAGSSRNQ
jgi:hypothetical protein